MSPDDIEVAVAEPGRQGAAADSAEENRRRGQIRRQLAMLRAHGIVRRISKTRRWMITSKGQQVVTLLAAAKHASAMDLLKKAA